MSSFQKIDLAALHEKLLQARQIHQDGELDRAQELYQELIRELPTGSDAYNYLGILQFQKGNVDQAQELIRQAIQLQPDAAGPYNNLGNILRTTGNLEGAIEVYREAAKLAPDDEDIAENLAMANAALERTEKAIEDFRNAVAMDPASADVYKKASRAMYAEGRSADSEAIFRHWLEQDPDNPTARHMLAATTGQSAPDRASEAYIRETFDGFAESFDQVLDRLGYQTPQKAVDALWKHRTAQRPFGNVLDAGCGTGLCGPLLRPMADRLTGVDLSANMLLKASEREVYDQLVQADLTEFLQRYRDHFDAIISTDTLIYFGDLVPVMRAANQAATAGGLVTFSLECQDADETGAFSLTPSGRYAHSEHAVIDQAAECGFELESLEKLIVRTERGKPVVGMLFVLRKSA